MYINRSRNCVEFLDLEGNQQSIPLLEIFWAFPLENELLLADTRHHLHHAVSLPESSQAFLERLPYFQPAAYIGLHPDWSGQNPKLPAYRDPGGFQNAGGFYIKPGQILYGPAPERSRRKEWHDFLQEKKIKTVLDLRSRAEILACPLLPPAGCRLYSLALDSFFPADALLCCAAERQENRFDLEAGRKKWYAAIAHSASSKKALQKIFAILLEADNLPLLFFCTQGKDRTGLVLALFLLALGLEKTVIAAEYQSLSKSAEKDWKNMKSNLSLSENSALQQLEVLFRNDPEDLDLFIACIESEYGSMDDYFTNGLQLDRQKRKRLQKLYLI